MLLFSSRGNGRRPAFDFGLFSEVEVEVIGTLPENLVFSPGAKSEKKILFFFIPWGNLQCVVAFHLGLVP